MAMDFEAEIRELKRRVSEGSFGFLTRQVQGVHKDLLAFEAKTEQRFDGVNKRFDQVDKRFDRLEHKVDGLAKALPSIVADGMRQVLREQKAKS